VADSTRDTEPLPELEHRDIETNGIRLHVVTAGPEDGDPVLLLHGFPEFWYGWRHQIPALVDDGYRVWVPDQRGYNRSEKPAGIAAYSMDELVGDAVGLVDAIGREDPDGPEQVSVVGHDWGAGVAWSLALRHPDRVERLSILNVPHPAVFEEYLPGHPSQVAKSWYMFFFQVPGVVDRLWPLDDWRGLRWFIDTSNREDTFSEADLERYRTAWSRPGAFTAMVNWYRALFQADAEDPPTHEVDPETLLIWGMGDAYLEPDMAEDSIAYCPDGRLERIGDATHWVQHEVPDRVNDLLLEFL